MTQLIEHMSGSIDASAIPAEETTQLADSALLPLLLEQCTPEMINIHEYIEDAVDLYDSADPYVYFDRKTSLYHAIYVDEHAVPGILGLGQIFIRTAANIIDLKHAQPVALDFMTDDISPGKEVWAPELHYINDRWYIYVAMSDGVNANHRTYVYEAENVLGPYTCKGKMFDSTNRWSIDQTVVTIGDTQYAIWSGWEGNGETGDFPQKLYIAKLSNPWTIDGPRVELAAPIYEWMNSIAAVLEGPQALIIDGQFLGITFAANASWEKNYTTGILWFIGTDPLNPDHWYLDIEPLFESMYGLGHGMILDKPGETVDCVIHHKTEDLPKWEDRKVCVFSMNKSQFIERYREILEYQRR